MPTTRVRTICPLFFRLCALVMLGAGAVASLRAQALPEVLPEILVASGAATESMFPGMVGSGMLLEALGPVGGVGAISPAGEENLVTSAPMTVKERLILFWNDTYASPGAYAGVGFGAMINQMAHTPARWDRDGSGYTRRFASGWGQLAVRNAVHEGMAGATGLDPRYVRCACKGTLSRSAHALKLSVTTYRQDGRLTLDVPQLAGAYGSGIVSTYWYPHARYNPLVQGVQFGHEQMGEIAINNLVQEFGGDIKRALHIPASASRRASADDDDWKRR